MWRTRVRAWPPHSCHRRSRPPGRGADWRAGARRASGPGTGRHLGVSALRESTPRPPGRRRVTLWLDNQLPPALAPWAQRSFKPREPSAPASSPRTWTSPSWFASTGRLRRSSCSAVATRPMRTCSGFSRGRGRPFRRCSTAVSRSLRSATHQGRTRPGALGVHHPGHTPAHRAPPCRPAPKTNRSPDARSNRSYFSARGA